MARPSTLEYCAINIAANPHPKGIYEDIFRRAAKVPINYRGDNYATISEPQAAEDGYFQGRVVAWTEINRDEPGIQKDDLEEIDLNALDINIPENIGLNGRAFIYTFREKDHTLFVETKNELSKRLSPLQVRKIFSLLFDPTVLGNEMPLIEITIIPRDDTLRRILGLSRLKRLDIHMVRPNADDIDADAILADMEDQGAKSQNVLFIAAAQSGGLEPNERTLMQASVAEHNGHVTGSGVEEDGTSVKLSTKEHPRIIEKLVAEVGGSITAALQVARETILRIRSG